MKEKNYLYYHFTDTLALFQNLMIIYVQSYVIEYNMLFFLKYRHYADWMHIIGLPVHFGT
jgi:hypothetical protein